MADDGAFVGNSRNLHSFVVTGFGIGEGVSGFVEEECRDKAYGEKDSGEKSVHEKDISVMILGCYSIAMAGGVIPPYAFHRRLWAEVPCRPVRCPWYAGGL